MPNPNLPIGGQYNVYTGARYVPLILGAWSETVAYEPLSVVTYLGNSYTSRTFVPAGVAPTNETYWAATGNYNAQVEQYRQEVVELSGEVASIQADIAGITKSTRYLLLSDTYGNEWINSFITIGGIGSTQYDSVVNSDYSFSAILPQNCWNNVILNVDVTSSPDVILMSTSSMENKDNINSFIIRALNRWPSAKIFIQFRSLLYEGSIYPGAIILQNSYSILHPQYMYGASLKSGYGNTLAYYLWGAIHNQKYYHSVNYTSPVTLNDPSITAQPLSVNANVTPEMALGNLTQTQINLDISNGDHNIGTHEFNWFASMTFIFLYETPTNPLSKGVMTIGNNGDIRLNGLAAGNPVKIVEILPRRL